MYSKATAYSRSVSQCIGMGNTGHFDGSHDPLASSITRYDD